jgi:hypothetical protein
LEKELKAYPKQIEEKKARNRERIKMQAEMAAQAQTTTGKGDAHTQHALLEMQNLIADL